MADVERNLETNGFIGGRRIGSDTKRELCGERKEDSCGNDDECVDDVGLDTDGVWAFGRGKGRLSGKGSFWAGDEGEGINSGLSVLFRRRAVVGESDKEYVEPDDRGGVLMLGPFVRAKEGGRGVGGS